MCVDDRLPSGKCFPPLFNFTDEELKYAKHRGIIRNILPKNKSKNTNGRKSRNKH